MSLLTKNHSIETKKNENTHSRIAKFLGNQKTGVLATVKPNGTPHAAAIYYTVDQTFVIRFMTKRFTRKSSNLDYSNHVMFVVYDEKSQTTAQITGTVWEITNEEETHEVFMNALRSSLHTANNAVPPMVKLAAGNNVAYRLKPTEIKFAAYNRRGSEIQSNIFESLDKTMLEFGS